MEEEQETEKTSLIWRINRRNIKRLLDAELKEVSRSKYSSQEFYEQIMDEIERRHISREEEPMDEES